MSEAAEILAELERRFPQHPKSDLILIANAKLVREFVVFSHFANIDSDTLQLVDKVPAIMSMPGWGPESPNDCVTMLVKEWMNYTPPVSVLLAR